MAIHFNSMAIGVGNLLISTVVLQGWFFAKIFSVNTVIRFKILIHISEENSDIN